MKLLYLTCAIAALAACGPRGPQAKEATGAPAQDVPAASTAPIPAGDYRLDKSHTSVLFRVDHIGFSLYTGRFATIDASLALDPENPEAARLEAHIDARSLGVESPPADFMETLLGPDWLDAIAHPDIVYRSTKVTLTGADTARIDGDLTFRGVTRPLSLAATFNDGYAGRPYEPNARVGFSAHGTLKRSDYAMTIGIPAPPENIGVGDAVEVIIETEFTGPVWAGE